MNNHQPQLLHTNLSLQWISANDWYATRGYEIIHSTDEGISWKSIGKIKSGFVSWCAANPLVAQAGRFGIQNLIQLASKAFLCIADGVVYRSDGIGNPFSPVFSDFTGRRPMRMGFCQDNLGRIYLGEYFFNREQKDVRLWRSDDDGLSWFSVHVWPSGKIRHIHFVQFDPYGQTIWLGSGDQDHESQISHSHDGGENFQIIGSGSQLWRAGSLLFTPQAIFWGTDIGIDHNDQSNYIIRYDRGTGEIGKILQTQGPAYYSTQLIDGTQVIGTCVEQANDQNDKFIHLLWTRDLDKWNDMRLWAKLMLPNVFGPAIITFPRSDLPLKHLLFNVYLTQKFNGSLFEYKI
jgi:hypothetical protein